MQFLYNGNREVVAEKDYSGNIIRYIRGLGQISSDSENAKTYYHYEYDVFGNTISCEERVANRFRYQGGKKMHDNYIVGYSVDVEKK